MDKICLIIQPAGLGDIMACQKIAKRFVADGWHVIWPVLPQLAYIRNYIKTDGVEFVDETKDFPRKSLYQVRYVVKNDNTMVLPLHIADQIYGGCVIRAKYSMAETDWTDWANYFQFERKAYKEDRLFSKLGIKDKDYVFVNRRFGTLPNYKELDFPSPTGKIVIETQLFDEYTPFDWCKVIENASEIRTVDTSWMWIIEKLNLKSQRNLVWARQGHWTHVHGLFKQPWLYQ